MAGSRAAAAELVERLFQEQSGRLVAHFARRLGPAHLDLAEEVVQDALVQALQRWPYSGVPSNPAGWLFRVALTARWTRSGGGAGSANARARSRANWRARPQVPASARGLARPLPTMSSAWC
jgi:predicted RNA polymerase sigma factor